MQPEADAPNDQRFLMAVFYLSDKGIKNIKKETVRRYKRYEQKPMEPLYNAYLQWQRQPNEVVMYTMYAYADLTIPKKFDCIFRYTDPSIYIKAPFTLTQSIYEGYYPFNTIDHGHKHLCIFTFENGIPDIIQQIPCMDSIGEWRYSPAKTLGICMAADLPAIAARERR